MSDYTYALTPFVAWLVCGITKFTINCIAQKRLAFDLIGYGGMPSNHSAIVSSMVSLIGFDVGIDSPSFGIAITLAFIVILDASSLRKRIEKQAVCINHINEILRNDQPILRQRIGHTKIEIFFGIVIGSMVGFLTSII